MEPPVPIPRKKKQVTMALMEEEVKTPSRRGSNRYGHSSEEEMGVIHESRPAGVKKEGKTPKSVFVTLPIDVKAGQSIKTRSPEGKVFSFNVPGGVKGGDVVQVEVPKLSGTKRNKVKIKIPPGVKEGEDIMGKAPDGTPFVCTVPPGYAPGDVLTFELPDDMELLKRDQEQSSAPQISGQFWVKIPEDVIHFQTIFDSTIEGRNFSYIVPADAIPGMPALIWPIGADRTQRNDGFGGMLKRTHSVAMSVRQDPNFDEEDLQNLMGAAWMKMDSPVPSAAPAGWAMSLQADSSSSRSDSRQRSSGHLSKQLSTQQPAAQSFTRSAPTLAESTGARPMGQVHEEEEYSAAMDLNVYPDIQDKGQLSDVSGESDEGGYAIDDPRRIGAAWLNATPLNHYSMQARPEVARLDAPWLRSDSLRARDPSLPIPKKTLYQKGTAAIAKVVSVRGSSNKQLAHPPV